MARGKSLIVSFKSNHQHQGMLLPPDLSELVGQNHPVRVVSDVLDKVDIGQLIQQYKPGGASNYHPRMLLKVLVFAYINNIYSSRKIEEALHQNINFMWLSGMSKPDHNTINRFRGKRLQKSLQPIFTQVVLLLCEEGVLSLKELYTDGTKIEANANRYTFVWGNSIKTNKAKMQQQLNELWKYAQTIAAAELDDDHDPSGFDKIDSEKIEQTIATINAALKDKPIDKKIRQKLGYAKKNWPPALERYAEQERIIGDNRSSYSKTDEAATFMRMKEDHMKNGQLKPAYNLQISTNNQYIVNYSLHQNTTDTNTLQQHLNIFRDQYGKNPANITADAGYGSEQNYEWLEKKRITAYVKYNHFDRDQRRKNRAKNPYRTDKLTYNHEKDSYICPCGKTMKNIGSYEHVTKAGFKQTITKYRAGNCNGCPLRSDCHGQKGNRIIEVNHNLNRLKRQAEKRLKTKRGIQKRKQRCHDTEPVFANIKHNHLFKRFMMRGLDKVSIEAGLLALAHNLRKRTA
ncbi:IS5/IS1182 family transposase [Chitinophaga caeni]|uniref:IS5/IS1182 family transposase n=1 Tax=Chitinophaga caeni TaxID=2029983 RepID=A0A291QVA8_9BACT|nr:IS1182 family transposase [Chitinophaga caeni]ATL47898.1 IS5/IS1182 family transposase [Chitinophaga caeni]